MSKTLGNNIQRATRGLGLAVTVGAVGAALTAALLVGQGGARPDNVPFRVTGPAVVDAPDTTVSVGPSGELGGGVSRPKGSKR